MWMLLAVAAALVVVPVAVVAAGRLGPAVATVFMFSGVVLWASDLGTPVGLYGLLSAITGTSGLFCSSMENLHRRRADTVGA